MVVAGEVHSAAPVRGSQTTTVPVARCHGDGDSVLRCQLVHTAHGRALVWPVRVASAAPVRRSQTRTVPSPLPVTATGTPSSTVQATALTQRSWPVRVASAAPVAQVPDPHGAVVAAGDGDRDAVQHGAGHRVHRAVVAGEGGQRGAGGQVPDPHRAVAAAGDGDRAAVQLGAGHRVHRVVVAGEGGQRRRRCAGPRPARCRRRRR